MINRIFDVERLFKFFKQQVDPGFELFIRGKVVVDQRKFVPAEARRRIICALQTLQSVGNGDQNVIANVVSTRVINIFKVVKVNEDETKF